MSPAPVLLAAARGLRHRVRVVHASTGRPLGPVGAVAPPLPWGWHLRCTGADVLLTAREDAPPLPATWLDVLLPAPAANHLDLSRDDVGPAVRTPRPDRSVRVALGAPESVVALPPLPMVLTVRLVRAGTAGVAPSAGRTVTARSADGTREVPLPETDPGTYRSAPVVWGADLTPADLRVGATTVRPVAIDLARSETRIDVVDPT